MVVSGARAPTDRYLVLLTPVASLLFYCRMVIRLVIVKYGAAIVVSRFQALLSYKLSLVQAKALTYIIWKFFP